MKKWILESVIAVCIACIVGVVLFVIQTQESRAKKAEYERLVEYAERQAVELAIIKQAAELSQLKAQMQQAQDTKAIPETAPKIADPKGLPDANTKY